MATPTRISKLRTSSPELSRAQDNIARTLEPAAKALGATPIMGAKPPAWIRPTLTADFADGAGFQQSAYHRDALGYTWLKLAAQTPGGKAANSVLFTLIMGYRPSEVIFIPAVNGGTGAAAVVRITQAGVVSTVLALAAGDTLVAYFAFLAVF